MTKYRIHTIQFAVPSDDPAYHLRSAVDEVQTAIYDDAGWSGSFNIIGTTEAEGAPEDHFSREALDLGAIKANASDVIDHEILAERTARAWGWAEGSDPSGDLNGEHLANTKLDRIRMAGDWVGACADIDVLPGEFPTRFSVDGHMSEDTDSMQASDGSFAPFRVFDADKQEYTYGEWEDKGEAQAVADKMNSHYHKIAAEGRTS